MDYGIISVCVCVCVTPSLNLNQLMDINEIRLAQLP
jgi:hypothetical protein